MLKRELNHDHNCKVSELEAKQQHQLPDHLKCGEVYTWLCADELYAVECKLCEDHPLCPLSEFPEHMDIWHTQWEAANQQHEENDINLSSSFNGKENQDDIITSFCNNDGSVLIKPGNQLQNENIKNYQEPDIQNNEEILEPFEQVLIEQDYTIESTQINEHVKEKEYFKDLNEQVADAEQCQTKKQKHKQQLHFNANQTVKPLTEKQILNAKQITENERDLQYSKALEQSDKEFNVNNSNGLLFKSNCLKFNIKPKNNEKKCGNGKQKNCNIQEIKNKKLQETSSCETSDEEEKTKKVLRKSSKTKNIKQNLTKIRQIKQTLNTIAKAISDLNGFEETESETDDSEDSNEYQNIVDLKTKRTKSSEIIKDKETNEYETNTAGNKIENSLSKKEKNLLKSKKCKKSKSLAKENPIEVPKNKTVIGEIKVRGKKQSKIVKTKTESQASFDINENNKKLEQGGKIVLRNRREQSEHETILTQNNKELGENETKLNETREDETEQCENELSNNKIKINEIKSEQSLAEMELSDNQINHQEESVKQSGNITEIINYKPRHNKNESQLKEVQEDCDKNKTETSETIEKLQLQLNLNKSETLLGENKTKMHVNEKEAIDAKFIKCVLTSFETRKKAEELIRKHKRKLKGNKKRSKNPPDLNLIGTKVNRNENKLNKIKINLSEGEHNENETDKNQHEEENKAQSTANETETRHLKNKLIANLTAIEVRKNNTETCEYEKRTTANKTIDDKFIECVLNSFDSFKKAECLIRKKSKSRKKLKEIKKHLKRVPKQNGSETETNSSTTKKMEFEQNPSENKTNQNAEKNKAELGTNENETTFYKINTENQTLLTESTIEICTHQKEFNDNKIYDQENDNFYLKSRKIKKEAGKKLKGKRKKSKQLKEIEKQLKLLSEVSEFGIELRRNKTEVGKTKINEDIVEQQEINGMELNEKETVEHNDNIAHSCGIEIEASEHETINMILKAKVENNMKQHEHETEKSITELSENEKQLKEYITKKNENEKQQKEIKEDPKHKLNENQNNICEIAKETSKNETVDVKFTECLLDSYNLGKKAEKTFRRKRKILRDQSGIETKIAENKISCPKINLKDDERLIFTKSLENSPPHLRRTSQSLKNSSKNNEPFQNTQETSESETELQIKSERERFDCKDFNGNQKEISKNKIKSRGEKQRETEQLQVLHEKDGDIMDHLDKGKSLQVEDKIKSRWPKEKTFKRKLKKEEQKQNQFLESLYKKRLRNHNSPCKTVQQAYLNEPARDREIDKGALKSKKFSLRDPLIKSSCETLEDETFTSNSLADSSTEFSESLECVQELCDPFSPAKSSCKAIEQQSESRIRTCVTETSPQKEDNATNTKQTLVTQFFGSEGIEKRNITVNTLTSSEPDSSKHIQMQGIADNTLTSRNLVSSKALEIQKCSSGTDTEPLSPLSPKTEEEHFEFYEPQKEKLNKQHISHLVKLYQEHPHLWDQSHPQFCEPQVCRKSWQQITGQWNQICQRQFTIAEVRIRMCTLCQRFVQERERLALEGELDEFAKFPYYEQMQFLEQQKTLQQRRELYEQQNEQILEIYENFPILWHIGCYKPRQAKERAQAFENIHNALKVCGINLSIFDVHKRIRSLRKCYRLEKIRYLHAQVEQTSYAAEFRHFERMQFLDKHIEPFVCRICDKIFENLQNYREHLEIENHGSILPEESDCEIDLDIEMAKNEENTTSQDFFNKKQLEDETLSSSSHHMESFSESENSRDILQRFTPLSCSPNPSNISLSNLELVTTTNASSTSNFPLNIPNDPVINSLLLEEDQLLEEIMENVTNNDSLSQPGLDQFINSVTNCEGMSTVNCLSSEIIDSNVLPAPNSFVVEHPDIVSNQTLCNVSPISNMEIEPNGFSYVVEHPDVVTEANLHFVDSVSNVESFVSEPGDSFVLEHLDPARNNAVAKEIEYTPPKPICEEKTPIKGLSMDHFEKGNMAKSFPQPEPPLPMKVHCIDLNLNPEPLEENPSASVYDSDKEFYSSADISTIPLPDHLIHKMIEFYRKYPQLWNPNHLDFNSRTLRRQAWCSLTNEFNSAIGKQLSWRTLHRKLTDYAKYYKKLITEQENYEQLENKWVFYEDFKFMDDVIAVQNELQRSVHHRDNNFKIINIYKTFPQLWDIKHPDYNKRSTKQRNIELMCNRLQEDNNLQLTTERLKNRLIELRTQYRVAKKQRLKCLKNQQEFSSNDFEFYEALRFLDDHIDPFVCDKCKMEFKKLTAYNQHLKKEHSPKLDHKKLSVAVLPHEPGVENICHICAIKFSTRSNLLHHIKRHEGIRNYECSLCPKTFYASYALKVHIRSHTKECPYTCEKCGLSFVSASKLNQHFKRHLNRKDFKCDFCPKAFFTAYERDRHTKRHLNIRDKICPICGKTFVAGSSYYAHLMLHSDTKRFQCDKCDMKFTQYPGLYKHKKRHHS